MRERGTWFRARKIARGLWHRGHDVTFVCTGPSWYRPRLRSKSERWTAWESGSWTPFLSDDFGWSPIGLFQRLVKLQGRYDLIYTFSHKPVDQGTAQMIRRRGGFWMTDWCDLWAWRRGGLLDPRLAPKPLPRALRGISGAVHRAAYRVDDILEMGAPQNADATSIISSWMYTYTRRLEVPDERVLHLISGSDNRIQPMERTACRQALGLPEDAIILGYIANITPDNKLLESALRMVMKNRPNVFLLSVGPTWYDKKSHVARMIRQGRAKDVGRQPFLRIPELIGACDVMLMPLRDHPFNRSRWPNKFSDYMAAGRPTAACDIADMGKVIRQRGVGAAGDPTPEGFAGAIARLVDDEDFRKQCGRRALETATGTFSWKRRIKRLCRFLNDHGVDA